MKARKGVRAGARAGASVLACLGLAACSGAGMPSPFAAFDLDLRQNGANTADAAAAAAPERPPADARGVISYPNYQVAVSRPGDTPADVAARVGVPAEELARYNGLPTDAVLGAGEILALPQRVDGGLAPAGTVDVTTLAGAAIDRAEAGGARATVTPAAAAAAAPAPVRHQVAPGETAFTIAQRYGISVRALAEWNGLNSDLDIHEGRYLLIPTAVASVAAPAASRPGQGTATPPPPSAATPLPLQDDTPAPASASQAAAEAPPPPPPAPQTSASAARLAAPVPGAIARPFAPGSNDGVDFAAPAGTSVRAAANGTVAAITEDTSGVPIVVIRHDDGLLTVYAGLSNLQVEKGDAVTRGEGIATIRQGGALHFEVRQGFEPVDPADFL